MHQADAEITPEGRVISNDAMRLFDAVQEQIRNFEAGK